MPSIFSIFTKFKRRWPLRFQLLATDALTMAARFPGAAQLIPEPILKKLWVEREFPVTLDNGVSFQYLSNRHDCIGRDLYWNKLDSLEDGGETETLRIFCDVARISGNLIVDIGANTGVFSLAALASNPGIRVMSFEPVPYIYGMLCDNIRINGWMERCQTSRELVLDFDGNYTLLVPPGMVPTSASTVAAVGTKNWRRIEVPAVTMDRVCGDSYEVDLVKIDVEGAEDKVLKGMKKTIEYSVPIIILEALVSEERSVKHVEIILKEFGYDFYNIRGDGLVRGQHIIPVPTEDGLTTRWRNWLCVNGEKRKDKFADFVGRLP